MTKVRWHGVTRRDSKRIRCGGAHAFTPPCERPVVACEESPFQVCTKAGISFWYYCAEHAKANGWKENR